VTLGVEWIHDYDTNEDFSGLMMELPLPFWDRNQGERASARAAVRRARRTLDAESLSLRVEFDAAVIAYRKAARNTAGYERDILPRLEESLALTRKAFEVGKSSYMDVLDAMLALIRARRTRLDHLEDQAVAAARIRYLVGTPAATPSSSSTADPAGSRPPDRE
jgi:cobalt-zinc-cadmium efflux system outer membrane protein